jgi:hypothetical protein
MTRRLTAALLTLATCTPMTGCLIGGCGDGNPEPFVGTWELHRTVDATSTPCAGLGIPESSSIVIDRDVDGFVIDSPDLVGAISYEEPLEGDYGILRFSLSETWTTSSGPTPTIVDYELRDDGFYLMGVARASLGTCAYDFSVHSI